MFTSCGRVSESFYRRFQGAFVWLFAVYTFTMGWRIVWIDLPANESPTNKPGWVQHWTDHRNNPECPELTTPLLTTQFVPAVLRQYTYVARLQWVHHSSLYYNLCHSYMFPHPTSEAAQVAATWSALMRKQRLDRTLRELADNQLDDLVCANIAGFLEDGHAGGEAVSALRRGFGGS